MGVDIFIEWRDSAQSLAEKINGLVNKDLRLTKINNRGSRVWPEHAPETFCVDSWRCRFMPSQKGITVNPHQIVELQHLLAQGGINFVQTQHLVNFNGRPGYTLAQDEQ
jgi:isocitrate dehydrogenase